MKRIFLTLILSLIVCQIGSSQVTKFRAYSMYMSFKNNDGSIEKNSKNLETDILIVMNIEQQKIIVYTEPKEEFDIIKTYDSYIKGYSLLKMTGVDNKGEEAKITIMQNNDNHSITILLDFKKYGVSYSVKLL